jgi:hypothetical protein
VGTGQRGRVQQVVHRHEKREERRRSERLPVGVPVFVRGLDEKQQPFVEFTTAWNISSHGALVATKRFLPLSTPVVLHVPSAPLPPKTLAAAHAQALNATPVYVKKNELMYLTGLEFSKPLKKLAIIPAKRKKLSLI